VPPRAAVRSATRTDTLTLVACGAVAFLALVLPANVREPVAGVLRRTVAAPFVSLQARAEGGRSAFLAHDSVSLVRDSTALAQMEATRLRADNDRLRKLLGLAGRVDWGFVPAEALHGRGRGEDFILTLTAGALSGVRQFNPVVAPEGLVGMVQTVDQTTSLAITWAHPDFRVSAMAADGSAFGIAKAHLGSGAERYLIELSGVPFRSTLKPGTLVISSGLGGSYPRGIPIGTVLREIRTLEGWARTYLMRPAILPPDITSVMILSSQRTAAGLQSVWRSAIDSATRAVAAAGDSIVRADSATRVRMMLDSLERVRQAAVAAGMVPPAVDTAAVAQQAGAEAARDSTQRANAVGVPGAVPGAVPAATPRPAGTAPAGTPRPATAAPAAPRPPARVVRPDTAGRTPPAPRDTVVPIVPPPPPDTGLTARRGQGR
jgi:rod shape-determining protein MreC